MSDNDNLALTNDEIDALMEAQELEVQSKLALGELELRKTELIEAVKVSVAMKVEVFSRVVAAHGLDATQWWPDLATGEIVFRGESGVEVTTPEPDEPKLATFPGDDEDKMARRRGHAVKVRLLEE